MIKDSICPKNKGKMHSVSWQDSSRHIMINHKAISYLGFCIHCKIEFQKTYSNPKLHIISKKTGIRSDYTDIVGNVN